MNDYIKREDAIEMVLEPLNNMPAADVVEVVRCEDCKWYTPADETYGTCYAYKGVYGKIKPTDYCSYGEREDK